MTEARQYWYEHRGVQTGLITLTIADVYSELRHLWQYPGVKVGGIAAMSIIGVYAAYMMIWRYNQQTALRVLRLAFLTAIAAAWIRIWLE